MRADARTARSEAVNEGRRGNKGLAGRGWDTGSRRWWSATVASHRRGSLSGERLGEQQLHGERLGLGLDRFGVVPLQPRPIGSKPSPSRIGATHFFHTTQKPPRPPTTARIRLCPTSSITHPSSFSDTQRARQSRPEELTAQNATWPGPPNARPAPRCTFHAERGKKIIAGMAGRYLVVDLLPQPARALARHPDVAVLGRQAPLQQPRPEPHAEASLARQRLHDQHHPQLPNLRRASPSQAHTG